MAVYTALNDSTLNALLTAFYGLTSDAWKPLKAGNANSNFHIKSSTGTYLLTIAEEKSPEMVNRLARLLKWLQNHQFLSSIPVPTLSGEMTTSFQGKPVLLREWIEGTVTEDLTSDQLIQIGKRLGKLHAVPAPNFLGENSYYNPTLIAAVIGKGPDKDYERWLLYMDKRLTELLPTNVPQGLVHGDLFFDNILFQNGQLQAFIDFEESCQERFLYDLGMAIIGICRDKEVINLNKVRALLHGYQENHFLSAIEKSYLPLFIEYAALVTSRWRYWKYNIDAPVPKRKDQYKEMVRLVEQVRLIPSIG